MTGAASADERDRPDDDPADSGRAVEARREADDPVVETTALDDPGFAPKEPTDGRQRGDWKTRYVDPAARKGIRVEASYVFFIHIACLVSMAVIAIGWPRGWLGLSDQATWNSVSHWAFAWLGGMLGGSLFAMKWMYHSVAKGLWNQDRRLWRIFTPLLSAGVGLTVVVLSAARVIPVFGADLVSTNTGAVGVAVLVGYFSDQTISKLADMAEGHLGRSDRREQLRNNGSSATGTDDPAN